MLKFRPNAGHLSRKLRSNIFRFEPKLFTIIHKIRQRSSSREKRLSMSLDSGGKIGQICETSQKSKSCVPSTATTAYLNLSKDLSGILKTKVKKMLLHSTEIKDAITISSERCVSVNPKGCGFRSSLSAPADQLKAAHAAIDTPIVTAPSGFDVESPNSFQDCQGHGFHEY
jgi:hypothetical protein